MARIAGYMYPRAADMLLLYLVMENSHWLMMTVFAVCLVFAKSAAVQESLRPGVFLRAAYAPEMQGVVLAG